MSSNPESPEPKQATTIVFLSASSLSLLGSAFIMLSFLTVSKLRSKRLYQMVFWMAFCDFFHTLKFFVAPLSGHLYDNQRDLSCILEAAISTQFFGMASVSWYFCITLNTFLSLRSTSVVYDQSATSLLYYHLFVWPFSALTAAIAAAADVYGPSRDGTCWILSSESDYRLLFYFPLTVYIAAALALLVVISCRQNAVYGAANRRNLLMRTAAFVVAFVAMWAMPCAFRWYQFATNNNPPEWMLLLHDFSVAIQGFVNCCVWATSPVLRQHVSAAWSDCRKATRLALGKDGHAAAQGGDTFVKRHMRLSDGSSDGVPEPLRDAHEVMADYEYGLMEDEGSYSYYPDTFSQASGRRSIGGSPNLSTAGRKVQPPQLKSGTPPSALLAAAAAAPVVSPVHDDWNDVFRRPLAANLLDDDPVDSHSSSKAPPLTS